MQETVNKATVFTNEAASEKKSDGTYEELHFNDYQSVELPSVNNKRRGGSNTAETEVDKDYFPVEFPPTSRTRGESNSTSIQCSSNESFAKKPLNCRIVLIFIIIAIIIVVVLIGILGAKVANDKDDKREQKAEVKRLETRFELQESNLDYLKSQVLDLQAKLNKSKAIKLTEISRNMSHMKNEMKKMDNIISDIICGVCKRKASDKVINGHFCDCTSLKTKKDCLDYYQHGFRVNGVYKIDQSYRKIISVYCDQSTDGGGWTVFQRRVDASVDFNQHWANYTAGFGYLEGNHWLGNQNIFTLSLLKGLKGNELFVQLEDWDGAKRYAKYSSFIIESADTNYKLNVSGYSGDAGDSLKYHDQMVFSAVDKDNDLHDAHHCAQYHKGGWWFKRCMYSSLNGVYSQGLNDAGIIWKTFRGQRYSLKFSEMKMRRKT